MCIRSISTCVVAIDYVTTYATTHSKKDVTTLDNPQCSDIFFQGVRLVSYTICIGHKSYTLKYLCMCSLGKVHRVFLPDHIPERGF